MTLFGPALGYEIEREDHGRLAAADAPFDLSYRAAERRDFDPRSKMKLDNQGPRPSCVGHGLSHCLEALYLMATGGPTNLSREFAYLESQRRCGLYGQGNSGATISAAEEVAKDVGLPPESDMPYERSYPAFAKRRDTRPLSDLYPKSVPFKVERATTLQSYDGIRDWCGTNQGPVLLGMAWTVGRLNGREINDYKFSSRAGGHCIFAFGGVWRGDDFWAYLGNSHNDGWALSGPGFWKDWFRHNRNTARGLTEMADVKPRGWDWLGKNPFGG